MKLILWVLLLTVSSMKRARSQNLYVQPRSRKIRSKIGIGIPRSQSKMYPVAPACLILFVKRISDILNVIDLELFVMRVNLLWLLKHTIGTMNDCLIRKNPILYISRFLVHDSGIAQAVGSILKEIKSGRLQDIFLSG
jgi:hypothetical protein